MTRLSLPNFLGCAESSLQEDREGETPEGWRDPKKGTGKGCTPLKVDPGTHQEHPCPRTCSAP